MINFLSFVFLSILLSACSFHDSGGFWTKEKKLKQDEIQFISVKKKEEINTKEFNSNYQILLDSSKLKINKSTKFNNNDGYTLFKGSLKNIKKYNFSKIRNYNLFEPNLTFYNQNIIFFDNNGTILNFDSQSKLIWKINNYSKDEKKSDPLPYIARSNNKLLIVDNLAKLYSIDINTGKILWSKKSKNPSNSQIKVFEDKFFVIDSNNSLNCYSITNGNLIWSFKTEKPFVNSFKKLSLIIKNNSVIFNNSLGDITSINIDSGSLNWQISTQNSSIYEEIMKLKVSILIENENSIYFSNNKNQFFSIDIESGALNWIQNINSYLKPTIIQNLIFTISLDGYFFVIDKKSGNILRITNLFKDPKIKKKNFSLSGFIMNSKELFISTNQGKLLIVDIKDGNIKNILKIDNNKISRAFIKKQNMYLVKDNSIIKLN